VDEHPAVRETRTSGDGTGDYRFPTVAIDSLDVRLAIAGCERKSAQATSQPEKLP
jgi:hypothetical protein